VKLFIKFPVSYINDIINCIRYFTCYSGRKLWEKGNRTFLLYTSVIKPTILLLWWMKFDQKQVVTVMTMNTVRKMVSL